MSMAVIGNHSEEMRVIAGGRLVLRINAHDPNGISKIVVQCFQFSLGGSSKAKLAVGELVIPPEEQFAHDSFEIGIEIPDNAAHGKWGVQLIEFTNQRGYKTSFYRGHGKFDNVVFEVIPPPSKEDELLQFNSVEIASRNYRA